MKIKLKESCPLSSYPLKATFEGWTRKRKKNNQTKSREQDKAELGIFPSI